MRPSSRDRILDAAISVTERDGITGLTLDSAAEQAGVTKGGLMYHFPTRDDLLLAIQRRLVDAWDRRLSLELDGPAGRATGREWVAAYVRAGVSGGAGKADLAFMVESAARPDLARVWNDFMRRRSPEPDADPDAADVDLLLARLAVDGLWLFDAVSDEPVPPAVRDALRRRLLELLGQGDGADR